MVWNGASGDMGRGGGRKNGAGESWLLEFMVFMTNITEEK